MSQSSIVTSPGSPDVDIEVSDHSQLPSAPVASVSMITYQHASFIKEALDSVLMQKVDFPFEICLGEDGSTDGTREICLDYARKHPDKIRLFLRSRTNPSRKSNKSLGRHNTASTFAACRGKFIALLEGDDYWLHPNKLQVQVNTLESDSNLAACCHYAASMQDERPWEASITPTTPVDMFSVENLLRRDVGNLHTSTWLLRCGKPMQWDGFKSSLFGDYPLFVWTLLQGKARVLPHIWSMYRIHPKGVFSPLSPEVRWRENVELWKCLKSIVPEGLQSALSIGMSRTLTMHTNSLVKAGKYRLALGVLRENLSGIAKMNCPAKEQNRLRLLAIESAIIPHLPGLRRRWNERQLKRSWPSRCVNGHNVLNSA